MADFQYMSGNAVPASIVTVVGSAIHLKVIPGKKEALPTVVADPVKVAKVTNVNAREKANFITFHLEAVAAGKAKLTAQDAAKAVVGGPIDVEVQDQVALPDAKTDAGLYARLFLAETPGPDSAGFKLADAKEAMTWMRVVVDNRLKTPSAVWGSKGATSLTDVIQSKGQFKGFLQYPTIVKQQQDVIDDAVKIANDGGDPRRARFKEFLDAVLEVANLKSVTDPCATGLYFWRTKGSGKPSDDTKEYMTKVGNTFYTIKK